MAAAVGTLGHVYFGGTPQAITDNGCQEISGTVFQIVLQSYRCIDPDTAVTVKVDTVAQSADTYSINYPFGEITFASSQTGKTVTISGKFIPTQEITQVSACEVNVERDRLDVTNYNADYSATAIPGRGRASGTIELVDPTGSVSEANWDYGPAEDVLDSVVPQPVLIEFNVNAVESFRCWAYIDAISSKIDSKDAGRRSFKWQSIDRTSNPSSATDVRDSPPFGWSTRVNVA